MGENPSSTQSSRAYHCKLLHCQPTIFHLPVSQAFAWQASPPPALPEFHSLLRMRATYLHLLAIGLTSGLVISSCTPPEEDEKPVEAVQQPIEEPQPVEPADPTAGWRTLKNDTDLPTEAQLADGSDSSVGSGGPGNPDHTGGTNPSTSVKPPPSEHEDRLDSTE